MQEPVQGSPLGALVFALGHCVKANPHQSAPRRGTSLAARQTQASTLTKCRDARRYYSTIRCDNGVIFLERRRDGNKQNRITARSKAPPRATARRCVYIHRK
ncbi:hypothetical protein WMY93_023071 [Mugilogobius chulae]|uniref:Secreted protein n=1 Tax=Mugilogobius chulae TaxID=88201 RepID=A0AAW0N871_9GOBI